MTGVFTVTVCNAIVQHYPFLQKPAFLFALRVAQRNYLLTALGIVWNKGWRPSRESTTILSSRTFLFVSGESIILSQPGYGPYSASSLARLVTEPAAPIATCLVEQKRGMKRALLEVGGLRCACMITVVTWLNLNVAWSAPCWRWVRLCLLGVSASVIGKKTFQKCTVNALISQKFEHITCLAAAWIWHTIPSNRVPLLPCHAGCCKRGGVQWWRYPDVHWGKLACLQKMLLCFMLAWAR